MMHILKCDSDLFKAVWDGVKNFEVRKNDRNFRVKDILRLHEIEFSGEEMEKEHRPLVYTGRKIMAKIKYIQDKPGLQEGYCVLGFGHEICRIGNEYEDDYLDR